MQQPGNGLVGVAPEMKVGNVNDGSALHARRIVLLLGRKSRSGGDGEAEIRALFEKEGIEILNSADDTQAHTDASGLIRRLAKDADAVVVGGGDGSVNQILPGLVDTGLPFCLIPLGTANNLARTMEIPAGISATLETLKEGHPCPIDLGVANDHLFVNVAGIGLSARINASTPSHWKKRFGPLAFVISAFKLAKSMVPFRVTIECDGKLIQSRSLQISIINGRYFGNGLSISDDHSLHDNELAAFSIRARRWWEAIFLIPAFLTGAVKNSEKVLVLRGRTMKITTKRPMKVDLDGDIQTVTPLTVTVRPGAARILCPANSAGATQAALHVAEIPATA
ncbi:MAG: lipid kinase [Proteobacteria bacterium]|nr:MAG: lipid kinase [Pseudomonadota bacterium]